MSARGKAEPCDRRKAVEYTFGVAWESLPFARELRAYIFDGVWRVRLAVKPIVVLSSAATAVMQ